MSSNTRPEMHWIAKRNFQPQNPMQIHVSSHKLPQLFMYSILWYTILIALKSICYLQEWKGFCGCSVFVRLFGLAGSGPLLPRLSCYRWGPNAHAAVKLTSELGVGPFGSPKLVLISVHGCGSFVQKHVHLHISIWNAHYNSGRCAKSI